MLSCLLLHSTRNFEIVSEWSLGLSTMWKKHHNERTQWDTGIAACPIISKVYQVRDFRDERIWQFSWARAVTKSRRRDDNAYRLLITHTQWHKKKKNWNAKIVPDHSLVWTHTSTILRWNKNRNTYWSRIVTWIQHLSKITGRLAQWCLHILEDYSGVVYRARTKY